MKAALLALFLLLAGALAASAAPSTGHVDVVPLNAAIDPITANYVVHGIQTAEQDGATAVIIELDTPGGLDTSMREIIRAMTGSTVPVVVYVGPDGARAGSAGVFITMAADVAAMAPNTNIGAAHPVGLLGTQSAQNQQQSDGDVEATKVLNDSVAYIRTLAANHGRDADWAEQAVRNSVSISAQEAVQRHVVDLQAGSLTQLLTAIDGRPVRTGTLHTSGAATQDLNMSPIEALLSYIADPTVSYLLMLIGTYGLIFELSSPGAILPGVLGGLALILGLLSLGALPVNYAGLALILFSLLLFVADVKMPSHGILTAGGVIAFLLGSLTLFNTGQSGLSIGLPVIATVTALSAVFFTWIVRLGVRA
ncbi:MAG: nodulation protein NfeD, partial [Chloroflexi bacterium]|nr:nodulation protein NfeD [Chloroflexota bacterium]